MDRPLIADRESLNPTSVPFFPGAYRPPSHAEDFHSEDAITANSPFAGFSWPGTGSVAASSVVQETKSPSNTELAVSPTSNTSDSALRSPSSQYSLAHSFSAHSPDSDSQNILPSLHATQDRESGNGRAASPSRRFVGNNGDGEDTPVLPIFQNVGSDSAMTNTTSTPVGAPSFTNPGSDLLASGIRREDIPGLNSGSIASMAAFPGSATMQASSVNRSITGHSPPLSSSIGSDGMPPTLSHPMDMPSSVEAQIRNSPIINDLLDRLVICEASTREVQRELGILHQKVNILVDRSLAASAKDAGEPEFKNPFAVSPAHINSLQSPGQRPGSSSARFSLANIHNSSPGTPDPQQHMNNDLSHVTSRLNTLTNSVGQLLALQTQQQLHHQQIGNVNVPSNFTNNHSRGLGANTPIEVAPKQIAVPHPAAGLQGLGHGFPQRPDLRVGPRNVNAPMRTWSTGNLDLPLRNADNNIPRQDIPYRGGKRGSVAPIARRESAGMVAPAPDDWSTSGNFGVGPNQPQAPTVKWESLPLAPELLRSIAKFGVGPPNKVQQRALPFLLKGSDIIAQAPPTQERIAAYVIPAIHLALNAVVGRPIRGPLVLMISTTVDQATQAQRMIRDIGGPIGVRSALGVGSNGVGGNILQDVRLLQQSVPHILCGTPQKLHALFTAPGGLSGNDVRLLVLDEVDQLIARNLHDFVLNIVKLLPPPRSRPKDSIVNSPTTSTQGSINSLDVLGTSVGSTPFSTMGRRFSSALNSPGASESHSPSSDTVMERQTALFSNTVPQDVLNLANTIQLREPVRVLVRRDGNVTHSESGQGTRGLRQFYLYLAFTGGARKDTTPIAPGGAGIIGSGRATSNPETAQAREWKLDALSDLFDDIEVSQAIVHVGGLTSLDSVVYKLANRGLEAVPLHSDMNAPAKMAALNKFRGSPPGSLRPGGCKILVVYDVQVKAPDVFQIPLVINYDLPKAVEEYAHRVAPAISSNYARAGVVVNFVTATGGDVEMLRSIECFYKIKCPEVPMSLRDLLL